MKKINNYSIMILTIIGLLLIGSCSSDSCDNITCENGGICVEGACDCPDGFTGVSCSQIDFTQIQALLDNGMTPLELINKDVPIDSLYGKIYRSGLIFYLAEDGTGKIAATEDQSEGAEWGCFGEDISNLNNVTNFPLGTETEEGARIADGQANTDAILAECNVDAIAAKLCRDLGEIWHLPSRGELNLMYTNLKDNGDLGGFRSIFYWSSTEHSPSSIWFQEFNNGAQLVGAKFNEYHVRAVRDF